MADFCSQCSIELFGRDYGDMKGLCTTGYVMTVLCEDCGPIYVNPTGQCVCNCSKHHYKKLHEEESQTARGGLKTARGSSEKLHEGKPKLHEPF